MNVYDSSTVGLTRLLLPFVHMQVNFLSQIRLSHKGDGPKVAKRLVDVYFALFKVLLLVPIQILSITWWKDTERTRYI